MSTVIHESGAPALVCTQAFVGSDAYDVTASVYVSDGTHSLTIVKPSTSWKPMVSICTGEP